MPSYIATHRATASDRVSALVDLADALLGRPISDGVTIRNVAVIPRTGYLYVEAEAPTPLLISRLFADCGLSPISVRESNKDAWAYLVGAPDRLAPRRHHARPASSAAARAAAAI